MSSKCKALFTQVPFCCSRLIGMGEQTSLRILQLRAADNLMSLATLIDEAWLWRVLIIISTSTQQWLACPVCDPQALVCMVSMFVMCTRSPRTSGVASTALAVWQGASRRLRGSKLVTCRQGEDGTASTEIMVEQSSTRHCW